MATGKEIRAKLKEEARKRARLGSMEERQAKKTAAPGSEGYKPTKTDMGPNMSQVNKLDGNKATTKATTKSKAPIVTKKQLEDSGFTNLRDYLNNKKGLTRRDSKAPERTNNKPESTTKSQDAKPNNSNAPKPDYSNKTKAKTSMVDKFKSLVGADREPTAKEAMGRNQMNAARKSMGFEKGGKVKGMGLRRGRMVEEKPKRPPKPPRARALDMVASPGEAMGRAVEGTRRAMEKAGLSPVRGTMPPMMQRQERPAGMKKGGSVGGTSMGKVRTAKPRNINGIAKRGLTRAKHR
jgi:hypothetical protein